MLIFRRISVLTLLSLFSPQGADEDDSASVASVSSSPTADRDYRARQSDERAVRGIIPSPRSDVHLDECTPGSWPGILIKIRPLSIGRASLDLPRIADRSSVDRPLAPLIALIIAIDVSSKQLDGKSREWLVRAAQGDYQALAKLAAEEPRLTRLKVGVYSIISF